MLAGDKEMAMAEKDPEKQVEHFKQMVRARSRIQPELIQLLEFVREYREHLGPSVFLRVSGLLASAGFSLWRAAFLFHQEDGKHQVYLDNVDTFVSKIISDNSIAFSDDRNTWSLWHYIGVARSSLLEAMVLLFGGVAENPRSSTIKARLSDPPSRKRRSSVGRAF
ncbi:hypothetical protein CQ10_14315 [Bradyrhizobium valentinum]|uniref:Uncharacterized protein n=2 Tax=Bradyrhizobium valentinum TaxID=1518501 RepID=A0A0R3LVH3_9BRAD|nr:hypothetical protein CQ10_14315 [Bradyrhizobium valentinum]KRR10943.1 hypothetical protein CP49_25720 [Bradyrhizobium valentinum]